MKSRLQPKPDECLFILTDSDLYPQENWTFVFGVTRPNLRTLIQSIARHDQEFPGISEFRSTNIYIKNQGQSDSSQEVEGGNLIMETKLVNKFQPIRSNSIKSFDKSLSMQHDYQSDEKYVGENSQRAGYNQSNMTKQTGNDLPTQIQSIRRQSSLPRDVGIYKKNSQNLDKNNAVRKSISSIQEDDLDSAEYENNYYPQGTIQRINNTIEFQNDITLNSNRNNNVNMPSSIPEPSILRSEQNLDYGKMKQSVDSERQAQKFYSNNTLDHSDQTFQTYNRRGRYTDIKSRKKDPQNDLRDLITPSIHEQKR